MTTQVIDYICYRLYKLSITQVIDNPSYQIHRLLTIHVIKALIEKRNTQVIDHTAHQSDD